MILDPFGSLLSFVCKFNRNVDRNVSDVEMVMAEEGVIKESMQMRRMGMEGCPKRHDMSVELKQESEEKMDEHPLGGGFKYFSFHTYLGK